MKTVYLSASIRNDSETRARLADACKRLRQAGYLPLRPDVVPRGLELAACASVRRAMMNMCECVCFFRDWRNCCVTLDEMKRVRRTCKHVILYPDDLEEEKDGGGCYA